MYLLLASNSWYSLWVENQNIFVLYKCTIMEVNCCVCYSFLFLLSSSEIKSNWFIARSFSLKYSFHFAPFPVVKARCGVSFVSWQCKLRFLDFLGTITNTTNSKTEQLQIQACREYLNIPQPTYTAKTFHAVPDPKYIFDIFLHFKHDYIRSFIGTPIPFTGLSTFLSSLTEDWQVSWSLK